MPQSLKKSILGAVILLTATACAQSPERASTQVTIEQAERAVVKADHKQAGTFARGELRAARTKLSKAKSAQRLGDGVTAERLALQALADAQLATRRAQAAAREDRAAADEAGATPQ